MSNKLIFYADDDPDDREMVTEAFRTEAPDTALKVFEDGVSLLHHLSLGQDVNPCLIILDVNMPMLSGKDTLRLLRDNSKYEAIPVVLFTTSSLPIDRFFAQQYKAGFVTKPLLLDQMGSLVKQFIGYCEKVSKAS
jgi:CheY-like chemotaxis protein